MLLSPIVFGTHDQFRLWSLLYYSRYFWGKQKKRSTNDVKHMFVFGLLASLFFSPKAKGFQAWFNRITNFEFVMYSDGGGGGGGDGGECLSG